MMSVLRYKESKRLLPRSQPPPPSGPWLMLLYDNGGGGLGMVQLSCSPRLRSGWRASCRNQGCVSYTSRLNTEYFDSPLPRRLTHGNHGPTFLRFNFVSRKEKLVSGGTMHGNNPGPHPPARLTLGTGDE